MKKLVIMLLVIIMMLGCVACGTKDKQALKAKVKYPDKIEVEDFEKQEENRIANLTDEDFNQTVLKFSYKTTASLLAGSEDNFSYSPISLYFALAVLTEGAEEDTLTELSKYLEFEGISKDFLANQTGKLYRTLYSANKDSTLMIANAVWSQKDFPFKEDYLNIAAKDYYASLFEVDFTDSKTADMMQKWVMEQTKGLIQPEINLSDDQVMTIMNTIYFNARFRDEFNKTLTKEDTFYKKDGTTVTCDFMHQTLNQSSYLQGENYVSVRLPFDGGSSILLVLPNEGIDVKSLVSDEKKLEDLCNRTDYTPAQVVLSVPKLDLSSSIDLVEHMKKLGVEKAFDANDADFSKMSDEMIFVSNIKQDVRLKMDEEGVEAAAYTEITMDATAAMPQELPKVEINMNRPFSYLVQSKEGHILFAGICQNP